MRQRRPGLTCIATAVALLAGCSTGHTGDGAPSSLASSGADTSSSAPAPAGEAVPDSTVGNGLPGMPPVTDPGNV